MGWHRTAAEQAIAVTSSLCEQEVDNTTGGRHETSPGQNAASSSMRTHAPFKHELLHSIDPPYPSLPPLPRPPPTLPVIVIPLIPGTRPEGIARASDTELFVACLSGAILHVDLPAKRVTKVLEEPLQALSGAKWCPIQNALFVAGTLSGKGFVYYLDRVASLPQPDALSPAPGAPVGGVQGGGAATGPWRLRRRVAVQLAKLPPWYINDATLTDDAALFTDSFSQRLWSIPRFFNGSAPQVVYYDLGPKFFVLPGQFKANGLAAFHPAADPGAGSAGAAQQQLLVANLYSGNLYKVVLPEARAGARVLRLYGMYGGAANVTEVALPAVDGKRMLLDGLWLSDARTMYAADNFHNRVFQISLGGGARNATVSCKLALPEFKVPTTLTMTKGEDGRMTLWAVNAHLDTCLPFIPCPTHKFELIGLQPEDFC